MPVLVETGTGVPLLLERHVHVRGYVSVPLYKHKTNSMVQTIATDDR